MIIPGLGVFVPAGNRRAFAWVRLTLAKQAAEDGRRSRANGMPIPTWKTDLLAEFEAVSTQMSAMSAPFGDISRPSGDMAARLRKTGSCTAKEAAMALNQTPRHVRRLIEQDRLPGGQVKGRWVTTWEAVEAYRDRRAA